MSTAICKRFRNIYCCSRYSYYLYTRLVTTTAYSLVNNFYLSYIVVILAYCQSYISRALSTLLASSTVSSATTTSLQLFSQYFFTFRSKFFIYKGCQFFLIYIRQQVEYSSQLYRYTRTLLQSKKYLSRICQQTLKQTVNFNRELQDYQQSVQCLLR